MNIKKLPLSTTNILIKGLFALVVAIIGCFAYKQSIPTSTTTTQMSSPHIEGEKSTQTVSYNQTGGITATTVNNTFNQTTVIVEQKIATIDKREGQNLKKRYPLGYVIFGIDGNEIFIPKNSRLNETYKIDWTGARIKGIDKDFIYFYQPDIIRINGKGSVKNNLFVIQRIFGQQHSPIDVWSEFYVIYELLEDNEDSFILVIGLQNKNPA